MKLSMALAPAAATGCLLLMLQQLSQCLSSIERELTSCRSALVSAMLGAKAYVAAALKSRAHGAFKLVQPTCFPWVHVTTRVDDSQQVYPNQTQRLHKTKLTKSVGGLAKTLGLWQSLGDHLCGLCIVVPYKAHQGNAVAHKLNCGHMLSEQQDATEHYNWTPNCCQDLHRSS